LSEPLTVIARIRAKPGCEARLQQELERMLAPTRAEPGCVEYILHRCLDDPALFVFYENWKSQADLDTHFATPHLKNLRNVLRELGERETEVTKFKLLPGK